MADLSRGYTFETQQYLSPSQYKATMMAYSAQQLREQQLRTQIEAQEYGRKFEGMTLEQYKTEYQKIPEYLMPYFRTPAEIEKTMPVSATEQRIKGYRERITAIETEIRRAFELSQTERISTLKLEKANINEAIDLLRSGYSPESVSKYIYTLPKTQEQWEQREAIAKSERTSIAMKDWIERSFLTKSPAAISQASSTFFTPSAAGGNIAQEYGRTMRDIDAQQKAQQQQKTSFGSFMGYIGDIYTAATFPLATYFSATSTAPTKATATEVTSQYKQDIRDIAKFYPIAPAFSTLFSFGAAKTAIKWRAEAEPIAQKQKEQIKELEYTTIPTLQTYAARMEDLNKQYAASGIARKVEEFNIKAAAPATTAEQYDILVKEKAVLDIETAAWKQQYAELQSRSPVQSEISRLSRLGITTTLTPAGYTFTSPELKTSLTPAGIKVQEALFKADKRVQAISLAYGITLAETGISFATFGALGEIGAGAKIGSALTKLPVTAKILGAGAVTAGAAYTTYQAAKGLEYTYKESGFPSGYGATLSLTKSLGLMTSAAAGLYTGTKAYYTEKMQQPLQISRSVEEIKKGTLFKEGEKVTSAATIQKGKYVIEYPATKYKIEAGVEMRGAYYPSQTGYQQIKIDSKLLEGSKMIKTYTSTGAAMEKAEIISGRIYTPTGEGIYKGEYLIIRGKPVTKAVEWSSEMPIYSRAVKLETLQFKFGIAAGDISKVKRIPVDIFTPKESYYFYQQSAIGKTYYGATKIKLGKEFYDVTGTTKQFIQYYPEAPVSFKTAEGIGIIPSMTTKAQVFYSTGLTRTYGAATGTSIWVSKTGMLMPPQPSPQASIPDVTKGFAPLQPAISQAGAGAAIEAAKVSAPFVYASQLRAITPMASMAAIGTSALQRSIQQAKISNLQSQRIMQAAKISQAITPTQRIMPAQIIQQRQVTPQLQEQLQQQAQITQPPSIIPPPPTITLPPITPIVIPPFFFGGIELGSQFRVFRGGKKKTAYMPSFRALFFREFGTYRGGKLAKSGLEYRPITPSWKVSRRIT